jgi:hypothetical protein
MDKLKYESPQVEFLALDKEDIISASDNLFDPVMDDQNWDFPLTDTKDSSD